MTALLRELRARVLLQECEFTSDEVGGYEQAWQDLGHIWAKIEPVKSTKDSLYRLTVRVEQKIKAGMRIKWGEKFLVVQQEPSIEMSGANLTFVTKESRYE